MRIRFYNILFLFFISLSTVKAQEAFRNPDIPQHERIMDLLSRLTVEEKIGLLRATSPEIPRLKIPKYNHGNEALHGVVRPGRFTVFPQAIGLASMWNPELHYRIATAISDEARARWNELEQGRLQTEQFSDLLTFWSPTVNMARDPRWGRTPETYGEDPFLAGVLGASFVKGLQGADSRYLKVVSTPKHFAANNEEHNRFVCNPKIPEKQLREYYLPAFEMCVKEGKAAAVMSAYNAVNDVPCSANPWLLTKVLRHDWKFNGYVVSDCGAPGLLVSAMQYVKTKEAAATLSIKAGLDLECGDDVFIAPLLNAYHQYMVSDADIDTAAYRVLRSRMRLGFFDDPSLNPYSKIPVSVIGSEEHKQLALEAARQSIVLLKNSKNTLPIDTRKVKSIAVVGINAANTEFGDYSGTPVNEPVSILQGIRNRAGDKIKIVHVPWESDVDKKAGIDLYGSAGKAARECDMVVAVLGINKTIESEGKDRDDILLPKDQREFIEEVYKINPNTVVVLVAGSSLAINWMQENLPAIVNAWYPGEQGGTAVAEVLFGDYNPGGRLPLTYYNSLDDIPAFDDYDITKGRTYQYFTGKPLYPFGFGLSYTAFKYGKPEIIDLGNELSIKFDVKNVGRYDGDEVSQIYVKLPDTGVITPNKELKGFSRNTIRKGETKRVEIKVKKELLRYWNEAKGEFVTPQGVYRFMIGASSDDIRLYKDFIL